MIENTPRKASLKTVRILLWLLVLLAIIGMAALLLIQRFTPPPQESTQRAAASSSFGGPFTLTASNGKPFSSARLLGKPYAMYFGFTRCGDVCPTTLSRMVKLRQQVGGDPKFNIVFVTIDPEHDGPREVGQYAALFDSPIIGLTGSQAQITRVKKQFGIYAQPVPNAPMGQEMEHSAIVLLFDGKGQFVTTISPDEPDSDAIAKLNRLTS